MTWPRMALPAILPALLALAIIWPGALIPDAGRSGAAGGYSQTEGYNRLINDLVIPRGWLQMRCGPADGCVVEDGPFSPARRADATPRERAAWNRFKSRSYLMNDMRDPSRWRVVEDDNAVGPVTGLLEVTGIDPQAHQVAGPYTSPAFWTGDLLYRTGGTRRAVLRRTTRNASGQETLLVFDNHRGRAEVDISSPAAATVAGLHALRDDDCPGSPVLAEVMQVGGGDNAALVRLRPQTCAEVTVAGRRLATSGQPFYVQLQLGESLVFRRGAHTTRFTYALESDAISRIRAAGEPRWRDPALASFSRGVEQLVTISGGALIERDLVTTLDPRIQHEAQRILGEWAGASRTRAAITVMDANTGEILALATNPYPENPGQETPYLGDGFETLNQNFNALPIGSVAKTPLLMAMIQTHPDLTSLTMRRSGVGGFRTLLGVDLGARSRDKPDIRFGDTVGGGGEIGFQEALARSSNRYAAGMMLLALRREPGPVRPEGPVGRTTDCYAISGVEYCHPPRAVLRASLERNAYGYGLVGGDSLDAPAWGDSLYQLFDVCDEFRQCGDRRAFVRHEDATRDPLWNLWPQALSGQFGVYPEHGNLGLDHMPDLPQDYFMSVLGGSRSRWSAIKVAEIFSRIVTRQRVEARLRPGDEPFEPFFDPDNPAASRWNAAAWNEMLRAMRMTVTSDTGTARGLAPSYARRSDGLVYHVFAKTGTPNTEVPAMDMAGHAAALAATRLARMQCGLRWRTSDNSIQAPARDTMRLVCREAIRDVTDSDLASALGQYANTHPCRSTRNCRNGSLILHLPQPQPMTPAQGHVVAAVVGLYPAGADPVTSRPGRALAIVVNLEAASGGAARHLARDVLESSAVVAWWAETDEAAS